MPLQPSPFASIGLLYTVFWGVAVTLCVVLAFCGARACVRRCFLAPSRKRKAPAVNNGEASWLLPADNVGEAVTTTASHEVQRSGGATATLSGAAVAAPPSTAQGGDTAAAAASGKQPLFTTSVATNHLVKDREEPACVVREYHPRSYGTAALCSMTPLHTNEAAVPSAARHPLPLPHAPRCPSFKSDATTADELEDEYADAVNADSPWRVLSPPPPVVPATTSNCLSASDSASSSATGPLGLSQTGHVEATLPAAEAPQGLQEVVSLNTPERPQRQANSNLPSMPAKTSGTPLPIAPARGSLFHDSDGGEAATAVHDLEACLHATRAELERAQRELNATLESTERVREEQDRIKQGIADMEQYRRSLDGIIAFTLRELEDAAAGVEEAEEKVRRESKAAMQRFDTMQSRLLGGS